MNLTIIQWGTFVTCCFLFFVERLRQSTMQRIKRELQEEVSELTLCLEQAQAEIKAAEDQLSDAAASIVKETSLRAAAEVRLQAHIALEKTQWHPKNQPAKASTAPAHPPFADTEPLML